MNNFQDPLDLHDPHHDPDFTCGMCAGWYGGKCHNEESPHAQTKRKGGTPACDFYALEYHGTGWFIKDWIMHHKAVIALIIAGTAFLGIWFFTGDIWAAMILFEILLDILTSMDF